MGLKPRVMISLAIGIACLGLCWARLALRDQEGADFTYAWRAARSLLAGQNPYEVIVPSGEYPYQTYFYYPLTTALAALPFAPLPVMPAAAVFFGLSSGLLAFALTAEGPERLAVFLGAPFGVALAVAQWAPLVTAAALLPGMEWLLACKPNIGAALFAYRPSWRAVIGLAVFGSISLLVLPRWPLDWLAVTRTLVGHPPPVLLLPLGPLLLLAGLRWRSPEGRLLLGLSLLPQLLFFYDQLPLALLARGRRAGLAYAGLSWIGYLAWRLFYGMELAGSEVTVQPRQFVLLFLYLPALALLFSDLNLKERLWSSS